jgi:hypothetical protein
MPAYLHSTSSSTQFVAAGGHWKLDEKLYFNQRGARVSAADYHAGSGMLVVAFTNGIFDLYELPAFQNVHTLSVTRERISSAAFNAAGNWVRLHRWWLAPFSHQAITAQWLVTASSGRHGSVSRTSGDSAGGMFS